jgi:hypothetical protein
MHIYTSYGQHFSSDLQPSFNYNTAEECLQAAVNTHPHAYTIEAQHNAWNTYIKIFKQTLDIEKKDSNIEELLDATYKRMQTFPEEYTTHKRFTKLVERYKPAMNKTKKVARKLAQAKKERVKKQIKKQEKSRKFKTSFQSKKPSMKLPEFFSFKSSSSSFKRSQSSSSSSEIPFTFHRSASAPLPKAPALAPVKVPPIPEDIRTSTLMTEQELYFASIVNLFHAHKDEKAVSAQDAQKRLMQAFHTDNMQTVKKTYKRLVLKLHPDKTNNFTKSSQTYLEDIFKFVSHYYGLATK